MASSLAEPHSPQICSVATLCRRFLSSCTVSGRFSAAATAELLAMSLKLEQLHSVRLVRSSHSSPLMAYAQAELKCKKTGSARDLRVYGHNNKATSQAVAPH